MVILRHCYQIDRRTAAALPAWERRLLVESGKQLIGLDQEHSAAAAEAGLTPSDVHILTTPGVG